MYTRRALGARPSSRRASPGFWGNDHAGPIVAGEPRVKPHFYDLDTGQHTGGVYYWYDDKTYQATASAKISHFADNFLGAATTSSSASST